MSAEDVVAFVDRLHERGDISAIDHGMLRQMAEALGREIAELRGMVDDVLLAHDPESLFWEHNDPHEFWEDLGRRAGLIGIGSSRER